jgi:hypothetical protein
MDETTGKYHMQIDDTGMILSHRAGISFDLTIEEALALAQFLATCMWELENRQSSYIPAQVRHLQEEVDTMSEPGPH